MDSVDPAAPADSVAADHELRQVHDAIALVASGGAWRATVVGLRFGDALLDQARRDALAEGVRLVPLWRADPNGVDVAIEPIRRSASVLHADGSLRWVSTHDPRRSRRFAR